MEQFEQEYKLSLYETLSELHCSPKSEISLVRNSLDGKFYIKKVLQNYNREVFEKLKQLETIHIPCIYEIFQQDKTLIVIEEFINGQTLEQLMKEHGTLSEEVAIRYMITLCEILAQLHQQQPPLIHRDIKPKNVMISNDGVLKLIDFDVSRMYRQDCKLDTHVLGTKGYASPEQFGFEQTDARSDIYSLGVMLNVLIVGVTPKEKRLNSPLKKVIEKCTYFSPDDRYQSVLELKEALMQFIKEPEPIVEKIKVIKPQSKNIFLFIIKELGQLPGYRRRFLPSMILATSWYFFVLSGPYTSVSNILISIMFFLMTLLNGNYKNIWNRNSLLMNHRTSGLIIFNLILFIVFGIFI